MSVHLPSGHTPSDAEALNDVVEALHRVIGSAIARGDWRRTVDALELLGDVHRRSDSGFARMTYRRARRIADEQQLPAAGRLEEKVRKEEART